MVSFTPAFGGANPQQPAQLAYQGYTLTGLGSVLTLDWPIPQFNPASPLAGLVEVSGTANGSVGTLPNATQGSLGGGMILNNLGAFGITMQDRSGNTVAQVAAGTAVAFFLTNNTFTAGTWRTIQYGAMVAQAQAAQLAGQGLGAAGGLLRAQLPVILFSANYKALAGDRASVFEWTGGAGSLSFDTPANLGNNWFVGVNNQGSGNLALTPTSGTIDGQASVTLAQGSSCFIISDGTNLITLGRGQQASTSVNTLIRALPSSGTVQLSGTEITAQIQQFTGALAANATVFYNATPGVYDVWNNTTGAGGLTFKAVSGDSGVTVAQGTRAILTNDGTQMAVAQTLAAGTVTQILTGSGLVGGPITNSGTVDIATTSGTPGNYDPAAITVDKYGRTTSAGNSLRALVVDASRTLSAGVLTASGGRVVGQPQPLTWSSIINIDLTAGHNFDMAAGTGSAQLTLSGSPPWGQGGIVSILQNASGNAGITFSPANTWYSAQKPLNLTQNPNARDLWAYYVDSSSPTRIILSPNVNVSSL